MCTRGAEPKVSRSQTTQQGTAAPVLGVVSPPPDKHSQMQTNSDLDSQIPALLAVLKIAERSACWLQSPSSIRAPGWSSHAQCIPPACLHPSSLPASLLPACIPPASPDPSCPSRPLLPPPDPSCLEGFCHEATSSTLSSTPAGPFSCSTARVGSGGSRFLQSHVQHRDEFGELLVCQNPALTEGRTDLKSGQRGAPGGELAEVAGGKGTWLGCWSPGLCSALALQQPWASPRCWWLIQKLISGAGRGMAPWQP